MTEERQPREAGMRDIPKNLKQYYLGLLLRGERWNETDGREAMALVPQQLAFLREQTERRRYLVAGPTTDGGEITGMMIIEAADAAEALALAQQDPGVVAGRLRVEIRPVYLPALDAVKVLY